MPYQRESELILLEKMIKFICLGQMAVAARPSNPCKLFPQQRLADVAVSLTRRSNSQELMTKTLLAWALLAVTAAMLSTGCASTAGSANAATVRSSESARKFANLDVSELTEREKWSLAREAYHQALSEQKRKDTDAAAEFYEATLELLGAIDLGSRDVKTQQVLDFQRKVLASYDQFMASVETLPPSAGTAVLLEAVPTPDEQEPDEVREELPDRSESGRDQHPAPVFVNPNMLPDVPLTLNAQVMGQISFFTNKGRKVMEKWMERSATVFPRLRPILAEEGIPPEVMYLSMIESGLNPRAYSYAHAAGVWQFIPGTARIYGLHVDPTYDERLHIEMATRAACRYLRTLYEEFGDWYLAFASYNCGEGRVRKEVARSNTKNYWGLRKLPRQTKNYVPAYLAARTICEHPEEYGFPPLPREVPFECERIWVGESYHLDQIAYAAGCDPYVLRDLNPEFRRNVTPGRGSVLVRLPQKAPADFDVRLASAPKVTVPDNVVHVVKRGETMKKIAARYGVTTHEIYAQPENRRYKNRKLKAGQQITIPLTVSAPMAANDKDPSGTVKSDNIAPIQDAHEILYTVHRGESLGKISRQLGVSVDEICRQNGIKNPNQIEPGQKLKIVVHDDSIAASSRQITSHSAVAAKTEAKAVKKHKVRAGDTVWSIAQRYGADTEDIMRWNSLRRGSKIYVGQMLVVSQ